MAKPLDRQSVIEWLQSLPDEEFAKFRRDYRAELARRGIDPPKPDERGAAQPEKRPGRRFADWFGSRKG